MKKNWKMVIFVVALVLMVSIFTGCGGGSSSGGGSGSGGSSQPAKVEKYPTSPINLIVAFAPGGGTDVGARLLMPHVEKELGVPVTVVNKTGGGGWVGWTELLNAKPDGYTIAYINTPNLMTGYLNPSLNRTSNLNDFEVIANHVLDYGAIAIRPSEKRFSNIKELVEYAKKNEVTASTTGVASDDHIAVLKMNKQLGTKFVAVHTKGAADGKASFMGGHIDVLFANVGEVTVEYKEKEFNVIAVMAPQRSQFLPEVPTLDEVGYKGVHSWSARGLAAKKGISKEQLDKLVAAFEKSITNPEHVKKMESMGLEIKFMKGQEYMKLLKDDEDGVRTVFDLLGWEKK